LKIYYSDGTSAQWVAASYSGGGGGGGAGVGERRHEWTGTYSYCGVAETGASESASVWTITRLTVSGAGAVTSTGMASAVAWTDRATATYT
tara:strand:+ start:153 stop:425 length:273 start_codon:yes stop_codon:yes gene_type:complete